MENAIWFSRHEPTSEQQAQILLMGFQLNGVTRGMALGALNLSDPAKVEAVMDAVIELGLDYGAVAVFGVFAAPVAEVLFLAATPHCSWCKPRGMACYSAWNVQRSAEGGKPSFEHLRWCAVGRLEASRVA